MSIAITAGNRPLVRMTIGLVWVILSTFNFAVQTLKPQIPGDTQINYHENALLLSYNYNLA